LKILVIAQFLISSMKFEFNRAVLPVVYCNRHKIYPAITLLVE